MLEKIRKLEKEVSYLEVELLTDGFNRTTFRILERITLERLELFSKL